MIAVANTPLHIQHWYESFRAAFIRMGERIGCPKEEASDMVSQFFLELMEKNIDPATISNPQAYLSVAFRRKLVDHYRRNRHSPFVHATVSDSHLLVPSFQDTLEEIQSNTELIARIRKAYNSLPARCRKVIYLKFYEGLTTEAIAARTALSKRTVYNNLFEGVKLLRRELQKGPRTAQYAAVMAILPLVMLGQHA